MKTTKSNFAKGHIRSNIGQDILVKDVMTTDVLTINKFESIINVAHILAEKNISGLPVVDNNNKLIGIVTQADILSMIGMKREHKLKDLIKHMLGDHLPERKAGDIIGDIMVSPALTIAPDVNIGVAAQMLDEKKIRRLPVVDENNVLIGIITRADILKVVLLKLT